MFRIRFIGFSLHAAADASDAYDANGNLTTVLQPSGFSSTMSYDKENRLKTTLDFDPNGDPSELVTVFSYDGDGLKQTEFDDVFGTTTTLIWDGMNVLEEQS